MYMHYCMYMRPGSFCSKGCQAKCTAYIVAFVGGFEAIYTQLIQVIHEDRLAELFIAAAGIRKQERL